MCTYTPEQVLALLTAAEDEGVKWAAFFATLAKTGMRPGEAVGLHWSDVDLERGYIRVMRSAGYVRGRGVIEKPTKTKGSRRPLVLGGGLAAMLKRHRADQSAQRLLAGSAWEDNGLVFTGSAGRHLQDSVYHKAFTRICERAGIPRLRVYDLRHTAASVMLALGQNPKVVAEQLGHSDIRLTLNTYSHVLPTVAAEAAAQLDAAFSPPTSPPTLAALGMS